MDYKTLNLQSLIVGYLILGTALLCTVLLLSIYFLNLFSVFHVFFLYYDAVLTCQGTTDEN